MEHPLRFGHALRALAARLRSDPRLAARSAVILCVAVALVRIALAVSTPAPDLIPDGVGYDDAARRLVREGYYAWVYEGDIVTDPAPNSMHPPGYPTFLAALYLLFGQEVSAQPLVSIVQAVLSAFTLWGLFLIGRRIASPRVGLAAVALGAMYAPLWFSYRYVLTEDLFAALCVWAAWAAIVAIQSAGRRAVAFYALAGTFAATATYVRAAAAAWLIVAAGMLLALGRQRRMELLKGMCVTACVVVLILAPWWVRNASIYDAFVPFNTMTAPGSLVAANKTWDGLVADLDSLGKTGHIAPSEELQHNRDIAALARVRSREGWAEQGLAYPIWRLRQVAISLLTYHPNPFGGFAGWGAVVEVLHLAVLALAARGAWLWRRSPAVWVLAALPIALTAMHTASLPLSRYFLPMMPLVIVLAALSQARPAVSGSEHNHTADA